MIRALHRGFVKGTRWGLGSSETRCYQAISVHPLKELDLCNDFRANPHA
jgi:hypothetical protein